MARLLHLRMIHDSYLWKYRRATEAVVTATFTAATYRRSNCVPLELWALSPSFRALCPLLVALTAAYNAAAVVVAAVNHQATVQMARSLIARSSAAPRIESGAAPATMTLTGPRANRGKRCFDIFT